MNKYWIFAIISSVSGALGFVGGYFYRGYMQKKHEEEAEKARLAEEEANAVVDKSLDMKNLDMNNKKNDQDTNKNSDISAKNVDYHAIIDEYLSKNPDFEVVNANEIGENPFTDDPYLIKPEQYCDETGYEKQIISYYAGDNIFANEQDEQILDINAFDTPLTSDFYDMKEDEYNESWYVRNDKLGIDYEIVRFPGAYRVIVMGENSPDVT